ncbi:MAG TPA: 50S ribosomal protein L11 methyltransferase [Thermoanaerobaculia bacterium]|nr:50S ribosomal protein L11 methyltransferase [Thermoanaerobaculia bacterium]
MSGHREFLDDDVRMARYREAIEQLVTPNDIVLDLGSGTGILAFLACAAGARKVYAIEQQHIADLAAFLTRHLGMSDRITILHDKSFDLELPERANVLVTETMGTFGLDEGILGSIIDARKRLLTPDAKIIPQRLTLSLIPVDAPKLFARYVDWWKQPRLGFDLAPVHVFASNTMYVTDVDASTYLATPADILSLDLATIDDANVIGETTFITTRAGTLHGFAGWFTATLAPNLTLSNAEPRATHWHQAFFPLQEAVAVAEGTTINVALESRDGAAWRWRGTVGGEAFDQTTYLANPPCVRGTVPPEPSTP